MRLCISWHILRLWRNIYHTNMCLILKSVFVSWYVYRHSLINLFNAYRNLTCFQMLLLKTCDQVLKEIHVYNPWLCCRGWSTHVILQVLPLYTWGLYFFFIRSKGLLIWELAKQTAWQVRSHPATIFLTKVIIHLYGLVGWLGWWDPTWMRWDLNTRMQIGI